MSHDQRPFWREQSIWAIRMLEDNVPPGRHGRGRAGANNPGKEPHGRDR
jgi:hypothetical protein